MSPALRRAVAGVAGAAGAVAIITIVSRIAGFGRWFAQSASLGDSATANAYASANLLPNVLFEVTVGGALAGTVVPLLALPLARRLPEQVDRIASALLTWAMLVLVPLGALVALLAEPIVALLPDSVGSDVATQRQLATYFLRIFAVQIPLYGVGVVLTGVLQAQRRFVLPALAPLASSLVVIVSYVVFGATSAGAADDPARLPGVALAWLAWGTTAGVAALSLPLLVPVLRSGVRLRPALRLPPGVARRAGRLAAAGIGALLAQQLAAVVALLLSRSGGVEGTITIFQYAQAVYLLPYAVFAVPLATVVFPRLAQHAGTPEDRAARHRVPATFQTMTAGSTRLIIVAATVGAALLVALAPAATAVFSLWGPMTGMTAAITWLAPGVVGFALLFHGSRVLYALDRSRAAVAAAASGWLVVSLASAIAVRILAPQGGDGPATLTGLAIGSTIGMTVAGAVVLLAMGRTAGAATLRGVARSGLVALLGGGAGAAAGRLMTETLLDSLTGVSGVIVTAVVGTAVCLLPALGAVLLGDRGVWQVSGWSAEPKRDDRTQSSTEGEQR